MTDTANPTNPAGPKGTTTENEKFDGARKRGLTYRSNEFNYDFVSVYIEQPFLGVVSMEITKLADEGAPTAYMGARKEDKDYELVMGYNPDFFRSLPPKERQGVICHELYHLIFQHVTHRTVADKRMAKLWNVATDLAINSIIGQNNLPQFCLFPGKRPTRKDPKTGNIVDAGDKDLCDFIEKAPALQASDYYFEKMKEIIDERDGSGGNGEDDPTGGMTTLDDHDGWGDLPAEIEEQLAERMRDLIEKAVRHCDNNSKTWGSIPAEIQEMIRKMISREIDWRSVIKNFIGRCRSVDRIGTVRKLNKRAMYLLPGARRKQYANFACFIDQSGSMSDSDIAMLFAELEGLAKEVSIDVFHFDTEVDEKSKTLWKKGRPCPKAHRTRCGGTDFNAVAGFCNRQDNRGHWSGIIILTDGYAPEMGPIIGGRVLWVITEGGTMEAVRPGDLACRMKSGDNGQFKRK
jgi:predicted metal-dependent peptidase